MELVFGQFLPRLISVQRKSRSLSSTVFPSFAGPVVSAFDDAHYVAVKKLELFDTRRFPFDKVVKRKCGHDKKNLPCITYRTPGE